MAILSSISTAPEGRQILAYYPIQNKWAEVTYCPEFIDESERFRPVRLVSHGHPCLCTAKQNELPTLWCELPGSQQENHKGNQNEFNI